MSGIVGQINNHKSLSKCLEVISYRGKHFTFYNDDFIGLAICSFDKKRIYENGELLVLFDGNIEHKSKSNEDYILNLYKRYKEDAFNKIKGSFSLCLYDKKNKKIILARDKFGRKPLYYTKENFTFASEIKCILQTGEYNKEFNEKILKDLFLYHTNPSDETMFEGIYKVPAGCYVIYHEDRVEVKKYYQFEFKNLIYDESELENQLIKNIEENFKYRKDTTSFLSSGIDSSLIVSASKVKDTYTVGYDDLNYSESYHTTNLCKLLDIENHVTFLDKDEFIREIDNIQYLMDEPCLDPAVIALYFGAKLASKKYKYIYSGEGADELFAGYNSYLDVLKYQNYNKFPNVISKLLFKICKFLPEVKGVNFLLRRFGKVDNYYTGVSRCFNENTLNKILKRKIPSNISLYNNLINKEYDELEQKQIIDINNQLQAEINATERMCTVNNIEVIMPFLNDGMIEIASRVPSSFKIKGNTTKYILRNAAKNFIPNEAYQNKKLGFPVPINNWMRTDEYYQSFLKVLISESSNKFFDQKILLKMLNDNYEGKADNTKMLFSIYCFISWYNQYFES